jgi:hypothetical protein
MHKPLWGWVAVSIVTGFVIYLMFAGRPAAQEHHHSPQHTDLHEQFYAKWNRPDLRNDAGARYSNCCNKKDCEPTKIRRFGGEWQAWHGLTKKWVVIPLAILEQNNLDMVESPDGQSHACISADGHKVYCATLGSGT